MYLIHIADMSSIQLICLDEVILEHMWHICSHSKLLNLWPLFTEWWTTSSRLPLTLWTPHLARSNLWSQGLAVRTLPLPQGYCEGCITWEWHYRVVADSSFIFSLSFSCSHILDLCWGVPDLSSHHAQLPFFPSILSSLRTFVFS